MRQLFSFGAISIATIYPLIAGLFYVARSFSFSFTSNDNYKCSLLFKIVLLEFGMFLSIIFEIISIFRRAKQNTNEHRIKEEFSRTINKFGKEKKIIVLICLCGFFDYIGVFFCSLIYLRDTFFELHISSLMRITEFFFVIIMYYFFLKHSLHIHHYVALGFIIIGLFLVFLEGFSAFNVFVAFSVFGNLFYASLEIIYKYLMEYKFVSVFELVVLRE